MTERERERDLPAILLFSFSNYVLVVVIINLNQSINCFCLNAYSSSPKWLHDLLFTDRFFKECGGLFSYVIKKQLSPVLSQMWNIYSFQATCGGLIRIKIDSILHKFSRGFFPHLPEKIIHITCLEI